MRLQRTVAFALRQEAQVDAGVPFARAELARFAWPWSPSGQGVLNEDGFPAVRLSASGEPPPAADAPVSADRLGAFGRSALRALSALETGPRVGAAPSRDLSVARKELPGWAVRLLVLALLLPALLLTVDAVARAPAPARAAHAVARARGHRLDPLRARCALRPRARADGGGRRDGAAASAVGRAARRERLGGDRLHRRGRGARGAAAAAADARARHAARRARRRRRRSRRSS